MHEGVAQEGIIHYARFNHEPQLQTFQKKKKKNLHDTLQRTSIRKRDGTTLLCVNGERDATELAAPAF